MGKAAQEIYETFKAKGIQGAAEIAQALFSNGNSYVPYGPGQNLQNSSQDHDNAKAQAEEHGVDAKEQPEQDRGGREM
jgi:hypothetical protein